MKNRVITALSNETGAVLVLALMTTTILAILSLTAIITSIQGLHMGAEYRAYQNSVYVADGGTDFTSGLISRTISQINGNTVASPDQTVNAYVSFCTGAGSTYGCNAPMTAGSGWAYFQQKVNGMTVTFTTSTPDLASTSPNVKLSYPTTGETVNLVVEYVGSHILPGSSTESAARYEGIGAGTSGGVGILYRVDAYNSNNKLNVSESSTVRATFQCIDGGGRCL
ncbi:MAG: hypothetical protein HY098_03490 [Nitrospinae bacterium]|nr:hypothetical protein [Nitrospinota bacterium]